MFNKRDIKSFIPALIVIVLGLIVLIRPSAVKASDPFNTHILSYDIFDESIAVSYSGDFGTEPNQIELISREGVVHDTQTITWSQCGVGTTELCAEISLLVGSPNRKFHSEGFRFNRDGVQALFDVSGQARDWLVGTWIGNKWAGYFGHAPFYLPQFVEPMFLSTGENTQRFVGVVGNNQSTLVWSDIRHHKLLPDNIVAQQYYMLETSTQYASQLLFYRVYFENRGFVRTREVFYWMDSGQTLLKEFAPATFIIHGQVG